MSPLSPINYKHITCSASTSQSSIRCEVMCGRITHRRKAGCWTVDHKFVVKYHDAYGHTTWSFGCAFGCHCVGVVSRRAVLLANLRVQGGISRNGNPSRDPSRAGRMCVQVRTPPLSRKVALLALLIVPCPLPGGNVHGPMRADTTDRERVWNLIALIPYRRLAKQVWGSIVLVPWSVASERYNF